METLRLPVIADSEFECAIRVTGIEDVLFIGGVNIFVSDNVVATTGFSLGELEEDSGSKFAGFSMSELGFLYLKLTFGKRFFKDDLPLDEEGPEDPVILASDGLGVKKKFTLLGVKLGVGGIFIATDS